MRSSGTVVAVVPARAGSKGIPGKNLRPVGGRSLVRRAVEAALRTETIETVVVSTDGDAIAAEATAAGARVIRRPDELSGDEATSESALLHALDALDPLATLSNADQQDQHDQPRDPEVLVFLQATSPFIDPVDLDAAVRRVLDDHADVVFAAAPSHAFLWRTDAQGRAVAVNHDAAIRPRRQDREPEYRETGAFYVLRTRGLREHRHRFFGRVELAVVDPRGAIDVDDPADLALASSLAHTLDRAAGHPANPHADRQTTRPAAASGTARWPLAATTDRIPNPHPHPHQQNGTP
ncbi:acylneuraminate cytidylyltransferase family protein [Curtobacterium sp. Csp1]|uniref:acylneuraminate cytidylyltransferase family protein n=1 Tax=unclassified Curtobacterium TaxID=257496 RepID=UPI000E0AEF6B|nr:MULTISPECIES: acylneuraminate cytidylyltransferase family protein [unclassified Curtobacterium]QKS12108.1 acylneuraminate cytidylyltransferase family protein [Curtobacterium sp. csp3]QKS21618.1 acylneuraminate cytidylyltransferase family protein [Curtobacterium sp. Csp1]RDI02403.1 CMP-N-acetylneuraminic acid synthetase [Curtobacterium sp. AG1037]